MGLYYLNKALGQLNQWPGRIMAEGWEECCRALKGIQQHIDSLLTASPMTKAQRDAYFRAAKKRSQLRKLCEDLAAVLIRGEWTISERDCTATPPPRVAPPRPSRPIVQPPPIGPQLPPTEPSPFAPTPVPPVFRRLLPMVPRRTLFR